MSLNITTLATRWGKEFGGVNQVNTFRATTLPARADTIAGLYSTAAAQRNVTSGLYDQTLSASDQLGMGIVSTYQNVAQNTLIQMCQDDSPTNLSPSPSTTDYLTKLVTDMLSQGQTFQKPTVTVGGSATYANTTGVTTVYGAPYGNGVIVGTAIDPTTGNPKLYVKQEVLKLVCTNDSYVNGATPGTETFALTGEQALDTLNALWPAGSNASTSVVGAPSKYSTQFSNAYFDDWTVTDTPDNWVLANLIPGTTITRSTDAYVGSYSCKLTAALLNAELSQPLASLTGSTNYVMAIRVKRVTAITGGVLTIGLRDSTGTYLQDALGNDLKLAIALTGASGSFTLSRFLVSVPRGFASTPTISLKITTAMVAAESIELATVEFVEMTSAYDNGPDVCLLPGSTSFADNDTYTLAVANSAGTTTFIGNLERLYNISTLGIVVPVAASPTQADSLIS